jgi:hypothetical protein
MQHITIPVEWVAVALGFLTGLTWILKQRGLVTFGEPKDRRKNCVNCADHKGLIDKMEDERKRTQDNFERIYTLLKNLDDKMDENFDTLNKTLSDHIGFCRGVQQTKK